MRRAVCHSAQCACAVRATAARIARQPIVGGPGMSCFLSPQKKQNHKHPQYLSWILITKLVVGCLLKHISFTYASKSYNLNAVGWIQCDGPYRPEFSSETSIHRFWVLWSHSVEVPAVVHPLLWLLQTREQASTQLGPLDPDLMSGCVAVTG